MKSLSVAEVHSVSGGAQSTLHIIVPIITEPWPPVVIDPPPYVGPPAVQPNY
jgi:hypothetical protein